eukprot:8300867-Pyramimonas_sp.AAC.1
MFDPRLSARPSSAGWWRWEGLPRPAPRSPEVAWAWLAYGGLLSCWVFLPSPTRLSMLDLWQSPKRDVNSDVQPPPKRISARGADAGLLQELAAR